MPALEQIAAMDSRRKRQAPTPGKGFLRSLDGAAISDNRESASSRRNGLYRAAELRQGCAPVVGACGFPGRLLVHIKRSEVASPERADVNQLSDWKFTGRQATPRTIM